MDKILPPHSLEAEEACLGSLMIDPLSVTRIALALKPEDFYAVKNGWIFEAMLKLGEKADLLTLSAELAAQNLLESVGGEAYLAQLTASVPTALNVDSYAEIVAGFAVRRRMINAAGEIAKLGYDTKEPLADCINRADQQLSKVKFIGKRQPGGAMEDAFDSYIDWMNESNAHAIKTGVAALDGLMDGGFIPGENIIIGSAPGVGKTSLGVQIVLTALKQRLKVVYFSFEVRDRDIYSRLISRSLYDENVLIPYSRGVRRHLAGHEKDRWADQWQKLNVLYGKNLVVIDPSTLTPNEMKAKIVHESRTRLIDLVVIDHLHHLTDDQHAKDEFGRLTNISVALRKLPKDVLAFTGNMPTMISMSQLSRDGYDEPELKAFKGTGQIESDAETAIFLFLNDGSKYHAPGVQDKNTVCMKVAKSRNGSKGVWASECVLPYGVFK